MNIGLLKEIKTSERRVLIVPSSVAKLIESGHRIYVETGAGERAGFNDTDYESAGAEIIPSSEKIFQKAQLLLKVHPPLPIEIELYRKDHISFSFLTVFNNPERAKSLLAQESIFFSAELIEDSKGYLPIQSSMSEIAAKMSLIQAGKYMESEFGGKGILLNNIEGLPAPVITILGAGTIGMQITNEALQKGADVYLTDIDSEKINKISTNINNDRLHTFASTPKKIAEILKKTDVLISAIMVKGKKAPIIVTDKNVKEMCSGSIIIDLAIDHGGSIETSRPTNHENPIYLKHGVIHYCIPNMPSALPRTASEALSQSALPYIKKIADVGFEESITYDTTLKKGLTLYHGKVVNKSIAESLGYEFYDILELLELNI